MINYQVRTGPEMKSVKMQSWLERAAGVIRGCDHTARVSWKQKCNDFSTENYKGSFVRMFCIISGPDVLPEQRSLCAWTQCFPDRVDTWLNPKLCAKPSPLNQPHVCPHFLIRLCPSVAASCHSSDTCTGNTLGLASPFCSGLAQLLAQWALWWHSQVTIAQGER